MTFTANSPFAYKYVTQSFDLTNNKLTFSLNSISDDFKPIYPNINITLKQASDISLMNMIDNSVTSIKNCSENKIITSSLSHTSLPNDFNYEFPKIYTSYEIATNNFSVSAPCTVTISYELPRKVGVY